MNTHQYNETFKIRASEVSPEGKITIPSICYLLQEVAGNNALDLNFDISQLKKKNLTWILHRLHILMDSFPKWRDTITIQTWPSGGDMLRAYRDFRILNAEEQEIGRCLTYWLMLDLENRRPVRIPKEIIEMAPSDSSHVLDVKKDRLEVNTENITLSKTFYARQSDLDMNKHVNNVKYIEWALEALANHHSVKGIDIEFIAECRIDNVIESYLAHTSPHTRQHLLRRKNDHQIVAAAESNK